MTAWRLARDGASVTMLDDGRPPAGRVAAGMLGPWSEAEHRDGAMHQLMVAASRQWPEIARQLATDADQDVGFAPTGTLLVAGRPEQIAPLREHGRTIGRLDSVPEWKTGTDLRRLEPGLGPDVAGGFLMNQEHQVDPRQALPALRAACETGGVTVVAQAARKLVFAEGRAVGVVTEPGDEIRSEHVVLAAGWSGARIASRVPLRPVKGQILRLQVREGMELPVRHVVRSADAYVAPRPHGEVVIGGTVEEASDTRVTAGAVLRLLDEASRLVPELRELELREAAAGLRPATPDGLPAVGRETHTGLIWATGAFRHGILLSPVIADAVVDTVAGRPSGDMVEYFTPERFAEAT
jgi:glycine oxidase